MKLAEKMRQNVEEEMQRRKEFDPDITNVYNGVINKIEEDSIKGYEKRHFDFSDFYNRSHDLDPWKYEIIFAKVKIQLMKDGFVVQPNPKDPFAFTVSW